MSKLPSPVELRNALLANPSGRRRRSEHSLHRVSGRDLQYFGEWGNCAARSCEADRNRASVRTLSDDSGEPLRGTRVPALMERLRGGADNPITRWRNAFAQASLWLQAVNTSKQSRARGMRAQLEGSQGPVDMYRPRSTASRIECLPLGSSRGGGSPDEASARGLSPMRGRVGVRTYTENLRVLLAATAADGDDESSVRFATFARPWLALRI